jgi:hypothetical protein
MRLRGCRRRFNFDGADPSGDVAAPGGVPPLDLPPVAATAGPDGDGGATSTASVAPTLDRPPANLVPPTIDAAAASGAPPTPTSTSAFAKGDQAALRSRMWAAWMAPFTATLALAMFMAVFTAGGLHVLHEHGCVTPGWMVACAVVGACGVFGGFVWMVAVHTRSVVRESKRTRGGDSGAGQALSVSWWIETARGLVAAWLLACSVSLSVASGLEVVACSTWLRPAADPSMSGCAVLECKMASTLMPLGWLLWLTCALVAAACWWLGSPHRVSTPSVAVPSGSGGGGIGAGVEKARTASAARSWRVAPALSWSRGGDTGAHGTVGGSYGAGHPSYAIGRGRPLPPLPPMRGISHTEVRGGKQRHSWEPQPIPASPLAGPPAARPDPARTAQQARAASGGHAVAPGEVLLELASPKA